MSTRQIYNDEEHGPIEFIDLKENVHSAKAQVRDIRVKTKGEYELARMKRAICEDINVPFYAAKEKK